MILHFALTECDQAAYEKAVRYVKGSDEMTLGIELATGVTTIYEPDMGLSSIWLIVRSLTAFIISVIVSQRFYCSTVLAISLGLTIVAAYCESPNRAVSHIMNGT